MDSSLNIIEVARVTPPKNESSESLTLPLTFYDLFWVIFHPVQRVIFYPLSDATRPYFDSVVVPNLKSSLALSLSHYLPLAGKIVWEKPEQRPSIVYFPNDSVSFTVAESSSDFSRLSQNEPFSAMELHPLVPELEVSDDFASAVSFQVTLFPNKGLCIGITTHHAVSDGKTTTNFLKSWAHTCKHLEEQKAKPSLPENLIPSYDRTCIKAPADVDSVIWNLLAKMSSGRTPTSLKLIPSPEMGPEVMRLTFQLTGEDIEMLRERLKRESPKEKELRLSTFVIAYSYALTCVIRARDGDPNRPVGYLFPVNCRRLVDPPIAENYFGNCIWPSFDIPLQAKTFLDKDGFLTAATMISDSVKGLDSNLPFKTLANVPPGSQILSVTGSPKFGVYGLDFGWGKPHKVLVVSLKGGSVSMAEDRDGTGGVEIGFSLDKQEIDRLLHLLSHGLNK